MDAFTGAAFTGTAFTGTAFTGAAYIQRCKKPSQALPCLGRPTESGSLAAGMCKCRRSAPFSTQHLQDHVVGSTATASQLALQPQALPEIGRAAALQPANGKPGWKGWKIGA